MVTDQNIAWHAGVSKVPDGRTNVNDFSIGIEMINTKDGKYTDDQYAALNSLIVTLKKKYKIKYILGHNEIAPDRKTDPWGIEWNKVNR
ncbi:MAG: N-acetylmuramyl-L-alanine amidase, negative regulator of AmpC, AmpD [Candidatus Moranbacteria bacterium GW2011_GWC2_37_73]|nr:MAG: N-acetylmuramyl-L-alanine amidase, negative regulator of AmpC, AmpD [Candidatus Moranbacteria bacterium GW2011_GWC2_37_73]